VAASIRVRDVVEPCYEPIDNWNRTFLTSYSCTYFIYEIFCDVIKLSLEFYHHITALYFASNLDGISPVVVSRFERFEQSTVLLLSSQACRSVRRITESLTFMVKTIGFFERTANLPPA
jgi:hypothetical protein